MGTKAHAHNINVYKLRWTNTYLKFFLETTLQIALKNEFK